MITPWTIIPLRIGLTQVSEIEVKYDLAYTRKTGWGPVAVLVEDLDGPRGNSAIRIEADCAVASGNMRIPSLMGQAIVQAAAHYFEDNKRDILESSGVLECAD